MSAAGPTWSSCYKLVKESRSLQQQSTKRLPHDFVFTSKHGNDVRMYFLAEVPGRSDDTIYLCDVPSSLLPVAVDVDSATNAPLCNLEAFRLIEARDAKLLGHPTREEQLLRERQRIVAYGITSYEHDNNSGRIVFPAAGQLYSINDSHRTNNGVDSTFGPLLPEEVPLPRSSFNAGSAAMFPSICPADPNFVAYVLNKNIYVTSKYNNTISQLTFENSALDKFAGTPSYIIQEEFDRYLALWWNPAKHADSIYLLYETVDEGRVELVNLPSHSADFVPRSEPFRFARAGTANASCQLQLCKISYDGTQHHHEPSDSHQHLTIRQLKLAQPLKEIWPEFEYLIRAGWANEEL